MNEMTLLQEVGEYLDPAAPEPPARVRNRVLAGIGEPARPPVWSTFRWRIAATTALAAVLAGGLIVSETVSIGGHRPASVAEAADVLRHAATAAEKQPQVVPRPDQFVYVRLLLANWESDGKSGRLETREEWLSVDGTRDGLIRSTPKTAGGQAWAEPLPGCVNGMAHDTVGGKLLTTSSPCTPARAYQSDLPTDVDRMRTYLYGSSADKVGSGGNEERNWRAFEAMRDLLVGQDYLSPRTVAALFRAGATIPGTTVRHDAVDLAGRRGIAVGYTHEGVREEILFDAVSYAYLGEQSVDVGNDNRVTGGSARMTITIVNAVGRTG